MSGQTWEKTWCNNSMSLHVCVKYETDAEGGGAAEAQTAPIKALMAYQYHTC